MSKKENNENKEIVVSGQGNTDQEMAIREIREQVEREMATLSTKIPSYRELSPEQRGLVDKFIGEIDLDDPKTIDTFGSEEAQRVSSELDVLVGTIRTHDLSVEDMFVELMQDIDGTEEQDSFREQFSKSPVKAIRSLANKPKKLAAEARYRRARVMSNIDSIEEKLESIRNQLRTNVGKLDIMAENSAEQYMSIQYQLIALQEVQRRIQEERESEQALAERSFTQIDRGLQLRRREDKIERKANNLRGVSVNAAAKAIMSRLLAMHHEELASDYDQDLSTLLPELKSLVVTAEANDSLIKGVETHNEFVGKVNEMLRAESERSREAMERVQEISHSSAIDTETARAITSDVLESVRALKRSHDTSKPKTEAFERIMEDFQAQLAREMQIEGKPSLQQSGETAKGRQSETHEER